MRLRPLTAEEAQAITKLSHSRTEAARLVERAKIIRLASEGQPVPQIAQTLGVGGKMGRRWLKRFGAQGMTGLQDVPRSGAPLPYPPEGRAQLIATALTNPRELGCASSSWTFERLVIDVQERLGIPIKKTRLLEILQEEGLRWRKQETWYGERVDPAFAANMGGPRTALSRATRAQRSPRHRGDGAGERQELSRAAGDQGHGPTCPAGHAGD